MNSFLIPKKKIIEIVILLGIEVVLYLFFQSKELLALFAFGYVWNWAASNELDPVLQNKRYRMSLLKTVINIQDLFLKPFRRMPVWFQRVVRIFPAGIFWSLVIYINDSEMPWWAPFLGSFTFEIVQLEAFFLKRIRKES